MGGVLARLRAADSRTSAVRHAALCRLYPQPQQILGPRGVLRYIGPAGEALALYLWPVAPGTPVRGVVLLSHGLGSYCIFDWLHYNGVGSPKSYEGSWVEELNNAGYCVAGVDLRGYGRSAGLYGYIQSYRVWVDDLLEVTRCVQHSDVPGFAGAPVFLCGTSLSGCLACHAALKAPGLYAGLVLLAPMVSLEKAKRRGINPLLMRLATLLNYLVPTWPLIATTTNRMHPNLQDDYDRDPVTYPRSLLVRVRIGVECTAACDDLLRQLSSLDAPVLVMHSVHDDMTDPDGSRQLVERVASSDKQLHLLEDGLWHLLMKEPGNERVLQRVLSWLSERTQPGGAPRMVRGGSQGSRASSIGAESWERVDAADAAPA